MATTEVERFSYDVQLLVRKLREAYEQRKAVPITNYWNARTREEENAAFAAMGIFRDIETGAQDQTKVLRDDLKKSGREHPPVVIKRPGAPEAKMGCADFMER